MSDLERHYEARGPAAQPDVCPVRHGPVLWIGPTDDAPPYLTCNSDRQSHFEWRRAAVDDSELEVLTNFADRIIQIQEVEPVAAEVIGIDFADAVASRLGTGYAGQFAALHRPAWGNPPTCAGCRPGAGRRASSTVVWPCVTAELALRMMRLTPSDIAITKE